MYRNLIIFSVFRDEFAETNEKSHRATILDLNSKGIETTEVLGVYKGSSEKSIMVVDTIFNHKAVLTMAKVFNQESILMSNFVGEATLFFPSTKEVTNIGKLIQVSEIEAKLNDSYTYIPETNTYLITK